MYWYFYRFMEHDEGKSEYKTYNASGSWHKDYKQGENSITDKTRQSLVTLEWIHGASKVQLENNVSFIGSFIGSVTFLAMIVKAGRNGLCKANDADQYQACKIEKDMKIKL